MRSPSPSAVALSLCWVARSLRVWLFWSNATKRKVTIVVAVLMSSCHVSNLKTAIVGAHTRSSRTHAAKKGARLEIFAAPPAKRSKKPTLLRTSLGISTGWVPIPSSLSGPGAGETSPKPCSTRWSPTPTAAAWPWSPPRAPANTRCASRHPDQAGHEDDQPEHRHDQPAHQHRVAVEATELRAPGPEPGGEAGPHHHHGR